MVTPGTLSGRPADSHALRAMSIDCGPIWETQPMITSSTAPGSAPVRAISSVSACAARSTGWTDARPPFRLPTGVRTAPTMYASDTTTSTGALAGPGLPEHAPRGSRPVDSRLPAGHPTPIGLPDADPPPAADYRPPAYRGDYYPYLPGRPQAHRGERRH